MVKFAQLPKYEAYKDSGVEWLGEIPAEWNLKKFKYLLDEINIRSVTGEETLLSLSKYHGVVPKSSLEDRSGGAATLIGYKRVSIGDLVINKMQAVNGLIAVSNEDGITSPDYSVYRSKGEDLLNINYLDYLLTQPEYLGEFNRRVTGVMEGFIRLYTDDLYNIQSVLPNINTQNIIVSFLDQKTAQIDAAIAIKEQQIELLKERKQIIIQQAVTQGLDPNVPMKDSGVEWIGQIPEHWEVLPLKRVALLSPSVAVENKKSKELVCFLPMEKVSVNGEVICDTFLPIKVVSQGFTVFNKNDVIVAKITPCFENGKSAYLDKLPTDVGYGSTEFHVLRCSNRISGRFLYLVVSSHLFLKAGEALMTGSAGQKRVPSSFITNFPIAIPSIAEQSKIIDTVDCQLLEINNVTNANFKQIQKLKEYKTTLINSAVTGKIKITPELLAK